MAAVQGYNVAFMLKVGNNYLTLAGRTQDDLTIAARTEAILKSLKEVIEVQWVLLVGF